jgi:hypothetical protein
MSSVFSPLKMKTFVQFSKYQPSSMKNKILSVTPMKQSYWANSRCIQQQVKPIMSAAIALEMESTQS